MERTRLRTTVVVVAHVNNDGLPADILVGNKYDTGYGPNQLLINQGNGEFKKVVDGALPNWYRTSETYAIRVGDMNNDGFPDLVIIGNYNEENKLLPFSIKVMACFKKNWIPSLVVLLSTQEGYT